MNDRFRKLQRLAVDYDSHLRAGTQNSESGTAILEEIECYYCHASREEVEAFNHFTSYLERRRNEMSSVVADSVHESRWGFHPVSYETFRKLKFLHKWYYQTLRDFARWVRWKNKFPHNRKGSEPQYCPFFVPKRRGHCVNYGIVAAYRQARMPVPRDEVQPLELSVEKIDGMYEEVKSWVEKQEKSC